MALQKHQIGIVASLVGLVLLAIVYGIFAFGDEPQESVNQTAEATTNYKLPTVPKPPAEEFTSKLDQTESELEQKKREELNKRNQQEIDLDVFRDKDPTPIEQPTNQVEKKTQEPVRTAARTKKIEIKEPVNELPKPEEKELDPDLIFASNRSTLSSGEAIEEQTPEDKEAFILHAVVHDQVTVTQGTRITLRTTKAFTYQGKSIPANTFLTATVSFNNLRVTLTIPPIPFSDGSVYNDKLVAYDGNDLVKGLYAKELLENKGSQNAAGEIIDQSSSDIDSRAARSVIRNLGRSKVREQSVVLRSNHPVLIKK